MYTITHCAGAQFGSNAADDMPADLSLEDLVGLSDTANLPNGTHGGTHHQDWASSSRSQRIVTPAVPTSLAAQNWQPSPPPAGRGDSNKPTSNNDQHNTRSVPTSQSYQRSVEPHRLPSLPATVRPPRDPSLTRLMYERRRAMHYSSSMRSSPEADLGLESLFVEGSKRASSAIKTTRYRAPKDGRSQRQSAYPHSEGDWIDRS
ncbi:hypothetical protein BT63DRAFT_240278 [Microthyrium microscopicum]|uniref:Uncharacterized protein n=1 Tax=Microthyrium microscopicum TaxID=703497 RepID=A0A6A6UI27_9PEZI|nr:hypothetical protein BT63DRAFT_240278 [Microthyrium microscopicum]